MTNERGNYVTAVDAISSVLMEVTEGACTHMLPSPAAAAKAAISEGQRDGFNPLSRSPEVPCYFNVCRLALLESGAGERGERGVSVPGVTSCDCDLVRLAYLLPALRAPDYESRRDACV